MSTAPAHGFAIMSSSGEPVVQEEGRFLTMHLGITGDLQSLMHIDAPDILVLEYTRSMMGFLLFIAEPEHIGMIGLGGGSIQKYCYRYLPRTRISVAEVNPGIIALRDRFVIPKDDLRFKVFLEDGHDFVARHKGQFDVLIVDGFDGTGQPQQLCSRLFYENCYEALAQGGIIVVNLCQPIVCPLISRISDTFEDHALVIGVEDSCNTIVFAGRGNILCISDEQFTCNRIQLQQHHPIDFTPMVRRMQVERALHGSNMLRVCSTASEVESMT